MTTLIQMSLIQTSSIQTMIISSKEEIVWGISFPFTYEDFLYNEAAIERKKKEYLEQIQRYKELILELEEYKRALVKG